MLTELGQVSLSSQCQAKDFGLNSGCIREGLGQFILVADVKAIMLHPEVCIVVLSLPIPATWASLETANTRCESPSIPRPELGGQPHPLRTLAWSLETFWSQMVWVQILPLPFTCCGTLGNLHNLSVSRLPNL